MNAGRHRVLIFYLSGEDIFNVKGVCQWLPGCGACDTARKLSS